MRILLVEDNLLTVKGLKFLLEHEKFEVEVATNAASTATKFSEHLYDLILLDINLPDGDGFTIANNIRESNKDIPIIFLTAKDDEQSIIKGFDYDADDYIVKPFRNRELISRINAALRRRKTKVSQIKCGNLLLDEDNATLQDGGKNIALSALEYKILRLLMLNSGRIIKRERLLDEIWDSSGHVVSDNTLTVYIKRIRNKISSHSSIETIKGIGYRMVNT